MATMRAVVGGTVFLAAFLLFAVEPMAAKQLLPVLGGSSAVWVTCLVFFQGMLLAGYLYAHWMVRPGASSRRRAWLHLALLAGAVAVLLLPMAAAVFLGGIGVDVHWNGASAEHPVRTIFLALGATIGLPFLVLAAASPMLQVWLARWERGPVPYRLFALSNVGSLLGLLLYPTVVEPNLTLAQQWGLWALGFGIYSVVCAWLGWRVGFAAMPNRSQGKPVAPPTVPRTIPGPGPHSVTLAPLPPSPTRWLWFLLPMAAAMQLSAVTSHLSQDVAAIPMLWVLPLGVYLITFILAFESPWLYRRWVVGRMLALMLASLGYALSKVDKALPIGLAVAFYLVELFVACWFCHAELYRLRPEHAKPHSNPGPEDAGANPEDVKAGAHDRHEASTVFYLLIAAGGVTGTFLIAVASPLIFRSNYDLPTAFLVTAILAAAVTWEEGWALRLLWVTGSALLLTLTVMLHIGFGRHALLRARNFYGSLRVIEAEIDTGGQPVEPGPTGNSSDGGFANGTGPVRTLMNGRIRHGTQMLETGRRRTPTTYYGQDSGVGVALRYCCQGRAKNVGVVGLGVGTLAAYGNAGDRIRFYEINPLVEPIARSLFTYLRDSPAAISVVEGDGRASLEREPAQGFDVLVVDAFAGDAIPLHLLTHEAMLVYRRQLAPGGVVAFHVSNSYLELAPEIRCLADSVAMQARLVNNFAVPAEDEYASSWVLVSNRAFFARPGISAAITEIHEQAGLRVWTDDYSSLLSVMRWGR